MYIYYVWYSDVVCVCFFAAPAAPRSPAVSWTAATEVPRGPPLNAIKEVPRGRRGLCPSPFPWPSP